jgi:hypothetical protein
MPGVARSQPGLFLLEEGYGMKIDVEIELTDDTCLDICRRYVPQRLEKLFKVECVDREKWFKKALLKGIDELLRSWEFMDMNRQEVVNRHHLAHKF